MLGKTQVYSDAVLYHYVSFIITYLWLTSHLRTILFLLYAGTPGTRREKTVKLLIGRLKQKPLDYKPSTLSIELNS